MQSNQDEIVIADESGQHLVLRDQASHGHRTLPLFRHLSASQLEDVSMLVQFEHDMDTGRLTAMPLTILKDAEMLRLLY